MQFKAAILTASIMLSGCAQEEYEEEKLAVVGQFLFKPSGLLQLPGFAYLTVKSFYQAKTTPGNLSTSIWIIDGKVATKTVWDNVEALKDFSQHGYHAKALQDTPKYGRGITTYFYTRVKPTWAEAKVRLNTQHKGVSYE